MSRNIKDTIMKTKRINNSIRETHMFKIYLRNLLAAEIKPPIKPIGREITKPTLTIGEINFKLSINASSRNNTKS